MSFKFGVLVVLTLVLGAVPVLAGEGKWGGEVFGDVYWFAAHHDSTVEDQNGMWFRRINLFYDYRFTESYSARVRLEALSPGDFTSTNMTVFIKDAWLRWGNETQAAFFGLQVTPTFNVSEGFW